LKEFQGILLIAGDGAPGRILFNLGNLLQEDKISFKWVPQQGSVAEKILQTERVNFFAYNKHELENAVQNSSIIITGSSSRFFQIEHDATVVAFEHNVPVIRIMDYPMAGNEHIDVVVESWCKNNMPPFIITALNKKHQLAITNRYPNVINHVHVIGNPLHYNLDNMFVNGMQQSIKTLRNQHNIHTDVVIGIFLSGNNESEFFEFLELTDEFTKCLFDITKNVTFLLNCHDETSVWFSNVKKKIDIWQEKGAAVCENISQDEIIVMSDFIFTVPFSTTGMRSLCIGKPPLYGLTSSMMNGLSTIYSSKHFPYLPELICRGSSFLTPQSNTIIKTVNDMLSIDMQKVKFETAKNNQILYPNFAMESLVNLIKQII